MFEISHCALEEDAGMLDVIGAGAEPELAHAASRTVEKKTTSLMTSRYCKPSASFSRRSGRRCREATDEGLMHVRKTLTRPSATLSRSGGRGHHLTDRC